MNGFEELNTLMEKVTADTVGTARELELDTEPADEAERLQSHV